MQEQQQQEPEFPYIPHDLSIKDICYILDNSEHGKSEYRKLSGITAAKTVNDTLCVLGNMNGRRVRWHVSAIDDREETKFDAEKTGLVSIIHRCFDGKEKEQYDAWISGWENELTEYIKYNKAAAKPVLDKIRIYWVGDKGIKDFEDEGRKIKIVSQKINYNKDDDIVKYNAWKLGADAVIGYYAGMSDATAIKFIE